MEILGAGELLLGCDFPSSSFPWLFLKLKSKKPGSHLMHFVLALETFIWYLDEQSTQGCIDGSHAVVV